MSIRTYYTATVTVPIYAGWKCSCCGQKNFSSGSIEYKGTASTTAVFSLSKHEKAEDKAASLAHENWKQNALDIISNPQKDPRKLQREFSLKNTKCTKCGKKPKWYKEMLYEAFIALSLGPVIFSGICAIGMISWIAWMIFVPLLCGIIYFSVTEIVYKRNLINMNVEYLPVIGSQNEELLSYAKEKGVNLPTPDETIRIIDNYSTMPNQMTLNIRSRNPLVVKQSDSKMNEEQYTFCRNCGAKLPVGSSFCHKCGKKVVL